MASLNIPQTIADYANASGVDPTIALEDGRVVEESETISDNEWPEYDDDGAAVIDV